MALSAASIPHDPWKLAQGRALGNPTHAAAVGRCELCHTLKTTEGEPDTAFINSEARTMRSYKIALGRAIVTSDTFGCTFCHSNRLDNTTMDDVLTDFEFTPTQHPIGVTVAGANNNNEFLSGYGSAPLANQLQCVDCHQSSLVNYPYHEGRTTDPGIWLGTWDKTVNPAGLQAVAAAANQEKEHCLACHGDLGVGNGPTKPRMGHLTWGDYRAATNTVLDPSGQALQAAATASCTVCHDTHSSTRANLVQDGLDRGEPDAGRTAIDESGCVAVCHAAGAFNSHGHGGKTGINGTKCTPCHSASISHRDTTDAASARRLINYGDSLTGNLAANRATDGRDNNMNGLRDEVAEQAFVYSKSSICKTCHMSYAGHGSGARNSSCLDCHDMHGDDAAPNNNAAMIRSTLFGENTVFTAADRAARAYYKGAGNSAGVCDNDACHGNIAGGLEAAHRGGTGAVLGQPCGDCHTISHTAAPNTDDSFKVDCTRCHGPGGSGPTVVWPAGNAAGRRTSYGSHLGALPAEEGDAFLGALGAGWTDQCNKCHNGHAGTIKVPAPPVSWADPSGRLVGTDMRSRLGLTWANEPGVAVHLGGTSQGGASEAEFCWGCHAASGVSEWGFNTKTTPAGYPVVLFATQHDGSRESEDHGWIYTSASHATKTSDWTAGYWQSEYDPLTAKRIASVHSTSFDPAGQSSSVAANVDAGGLVNRTAPALEAKGYLRCSNCHDVHDTFGPDGKPYLRGRWAGNPYPPELPPRGGYAYTTYINTLTGTTTPRALSTARDKGGYFIDQNSAWPTNNPALDTLQETADLCALCHGTNVDSMDYYTGRKLWRAPMVNGHSNAALGGTGANKVDLFSGHRGDSYGLGMGMQASAGSTPWACGGDGLSCDYSYPQLQSCCICEWDCGNILSSGWYGADYANWYGAGTVGGASGAGSMAHRFTCSKCHSPHASGLPALLPQNCIDPAQGNYTVNGFSGLNLVANNCHRKTSTTDGWHVLAPGQ